MSAELMSTWGSVEETGFLYGKVSSDEEENVAEGGEQEPWFRMGGHLRGVTLDRQPAGRGHVKRTLPMQADLELGGRFGRTTAVLTLGFRAKSYGVDKLDELFSRRHYLLYQLDGVSSVRFGKFMPVLGLGGPDHVSATRRGLGWDQGSESQNLEYSYLSEFYSHQLTFISPNPESMSAPRETGAAFTTSAFVGGESKVGFSVFHGEEKTTSTKRSVAGPFWIWSFTEKIYLSSELFFQDARPVDAPAKKGYATFQRFNFEVLKGLTPFLQFDRSYLDESNRAAKFETLGLGARWLPRPHYEFVLFAGNEKSGDLSATPYCWLMAHIYL